MSLRLLLPLISFCLFAGSLIAQRAGVPWKDGERVLFLGDSITQDARYVTLVELYLWDRYPERDIEIINVGQSGETVSGISENPRPRGNIQNRMDRALSESKPDWVLICYGMNDGIYHPPRPAIVEAYTTGMTKVIEASKKTGAKVILLAPPVFDALSKKPETLRGVDAEKHGYPTPYRHYNAVLQGFGKWTREQDAAFHIDFQVPLLSYIKQQREHDPNYKFGDGVHPDNGGHFTMAIAVLEGLGEDAKEVEERLTQLTGIARFNGQKVAPAENPDLINQALQRHRQFSGLWRKHVVNKNSAGIEDAQKAADEAEKKFRAALAK